MTKVCEMYLVLFIVSGLFMGSDAGLFDTVVMDVKSYMFEPCRPEPQNETANFTLHDLYVTGDGTGDLRFAANFTLRTNITSPLKVALEVKKSVFFGLALLRVPCIAGYGSCTIQDMCENGMPEELECPRFWDMEPACRCPLEPGKYTMPGLWVADLAKTNWAFIVSGYYTAMITLYQRNTEITCYRIEFTLG